MNTPEDVRADVLARALEDRGYDSLWLGEHSHIPISRRTPYPAGGELPRQYQRMMNPFVSLAMAAMATTTLKLATGVALPLEHDVLDLAKSVATLDVVSDGRVIFGVGVGWNEEELANHRPFPFARRYSALEDCVTALRSLWSDDEAEHHGEFYDFDPVWSFPKPVQRPYPPVALGVGGRLGTTHAARWADEWAPLDIALGDVGKKIGKFREAVVEAGRADVPISLVVFGDPTWETLVRYRDLGVQRVVLGSAPNRWDDPSTTMDFIDTYAQFITDLA